MNIISSLKSFFGFKPKNTDTETADESLLTSNPGALIQANPDAIQEIVEAEKVEVETSIVGLTVETPIIQVVEDKLPEQPVANKTNYITVNVTLDKAQDNYHSFSPEERAGIIKDHPGYESAASDPIKFYNLIVSANIEPRA